MHARLPSLTAAIVAAARDVASWHLAADLGVDHQARHLLPLPVARGLELLDELSPRIPMLAPVLRMAGLGIVTHIAWRTEILDRAVAQAARAGVRQLVILGAGLDARAWRMPALADVTVFEVDHPATQAWKRTKIENLQRLAADVRLVAVDFERQRVSDQLAAAGHEAAQPTLWLWEGVTMYLTREAIAATLGELAQRSAQGSILAMTYLTPEIVRLPKALHPIVRLGFHLLREPLAGTLRPQEAATLLQQHRLAVAADEGSPVRLFACERVLVTTGRA